MTYHAGRAAEWPAHGNRQRRNQLFPRLELTPDFNRGELRLSAEVMLAEINGTTVPALPRQRAIHTLTMLANQ